MKLKIKQYVYEKKEVDSKEVELPTEVSYFFETGIRRSIKVIPVYTTWFKEEYGKDEELCQLIFICLYQSFECVAEKITISASDIERLYFSEDKNDSKHSSLVRGLIDGHFDKRTKEQFENDFNSVLSALNPE